MRLYLAGPMRGHEDHNRPAFAFATEVLRAAGHEVFNPHDLDQSMGDRAAMEIEVSWIARHAEHVALLPGWEKSRGARAEVALADALSIPWSPWMECL